MPTCIYDNVCGNWHRGSLHLHTTASDGHLTVEEVAGTYYAEGYDFICLTAIPLSYHPKTDPFLKRR